MTLVQNANQLVPGDIASLELASRTWANLAEALHEGAQPVGGSQQLTTAEAHLVAQAIAALSAALGTLRADAEQIYADLRSLALPDEVLFGDPPLMRSVVQERPELREPLERLVARGTSTRLAFVDAQHDLIDVVQPIAHRFVGQQGSV